MRRSIVSLILYGLATAAPAQEFSYDGNRWVEIEISVFTNEYGADIDSELYIPEKIRLSYPDGIRQLIPVYSSLMINFDRAAGENLNAARAPTGAALPEALPAAGADNELTAAELPFDAGLSSGTVYGPEYSPAEDDFRVLDLSRDPFIALGDRAAQFQDMNADLDSSPRHRLLYHAVWRQPLQGRAQATAIFVRGGDRYGRHNELEGSVSFSFANGRVVLDADLWLNRFTSARNAGDGNAPGEWNVPPQPFAPEGEADEAVGARRGGAIEEAVIREVAHLQQTRSMNTGTLHYLDHPAFGVLAEVRAYELPDDFP